MRPIPAWHLLLDVAALATAIVSGVAGQSSGFGEEPTDEALVRRIADGDGDALADLYDRQIRLVFSLACRILPRQVEAEEVAQDVFTYAWRHAARFDPRRGTVAAWLLVMTRSRALDRLRAQRSRPDTVPAADDRALLQLADTRDDLEQRLLASGEVDRLRTALADLPTAEREAIELAYYEGLSQSEIAERLQQPLGTVKTRVRTGMIRLRAALTGLPA